MLLIVGLGNPGEKYHWNRHNVGFLVLDKLATELEVEFSRNKYVEAEIAKHPDVSLLKPLTYVNESGRAVKLAKESHDISPDEIWVVHDETEIPFGEIRIKHGGTSAGHNGIKSVDEAVGVNYWRIRIGVGRPEDRQYELSDYVLADFTPDERQQLTAVIDQVAAYLVQSLKDKQLQPIKINAQKENTNQPD